MHKRTRETKRALNRLNTYHEKVAHLKDLYANERLFLLAPGPSLGEVDEQELRAKLKNSLTFSVKQAYLKYKNETDFHFINDCNLPMINGYPGYVYGIKSGPITIASSGYPEEHARQRYAHHQHWDIFCRVLDPLVYQDQNLQRLCESNDFDSGLFDNMLDRPCGPSITLETVLYMAVHVGAKDIYAIGWDSGDKAGEHFYDDETHLTSNREFEYAMVQKASSPLYNWLKEQGVNLHLISKISALSDEIPRLNLKDI